MKQNETLSDAKTVINGKELHPTDASMKNKILLISIVVAIFVFSIGLIVWVVMQESEF